MLLMAAQMAETDIADGEVDDLFSHQGPLLLTWFNFNASMDK